MTIHVLQPKPRDEQVVRHQLIATCEDVKQEIVKATSLKEAYALYDALRSLEREIQHLVNLAADRCEKILGEL